MNWDQVEGKWKQAGGKVKEKWGRLTDDDLQVVAGKRDQVDEFSRTYGTDQTTTREKTHTASGH
jgi:uncharacterized protein YjbJ (UPF0337 family)